MRLKNEVETQNTREARPRANESVSGCLETGAASGEAVVVVRSALADLQPRKWDRLAALKPPKTCPGRAVFRALFLGHFWSTVTFGNGEDFDGRVLETSRAEFGASKRQAAKD